MDFYCNFASEHAQILLSDFMQVIKIMQKYQPKLKKEPQSCNLIVSITRL